LFVDVGLAITWMEEERSGVGRGVVVDCLPLIECKPASLYSVGKDWIRRSMLSCVIVIMLA
jgi:hypothetical protein